MVLSLAIDTNLVTLVNPHEQHSNGSNETFQNLAKGENMNMTHFSLLQLPETQQESGSPLSVKCQSTEVLFNILQESFLGPVPVCPWVSKKVLISMVIWFPCPSSWKKNESEMEEETTKGRYTNCTQEVVTVRKGEEWSGWIKKLNIQNHSSL